MIVRGSCALSKARQSKLQLNKLVDGNKACVVTNRCSREISTLDIARYVLTFFLHVKRKRRDFYARDLYYLGFLHKLRIN